MDIVNLTTDDIKKTLEKINAGATPNVDDKNPKLYVFVYDVNVTLFADGINPRLAGLNKARIRYVFRKPFRNEFISGALANRSGWATYVFTSPSISGMFYKKTNYHLVTGNDMFPDASSFQRDVRGFYRHYG